MFIKKLSIAVFVCFMALPFSSNAALVTGNVLNFTPGAYDGAGNVSGSYFGMDSNKDGIIQNAEKILISQNEGLRIGVAQTASGSHTGSPDGSESPTIDNPWITFTNTGMHSSTGPVSEISEGSLDFSSWGLIWNGVAYDLGGDAIQSDTGIASISCSSISCTTGDSYTLDYLAHFSLSDPSVKGSTLYVLRLEGSISNVPVPAAAWLFVSGLLGFIGLAKKRNRHG